jgi:heme-degrading monooxygenase HmoA
MSIVKINVLTVPTDMRATLEARFAGRAGMVEKADGFEHFELLRPVEGTDTYLVYTRWRSEEDFQAWQSSQAFGEGHRQAAAASGQAGPGRGGHPGGQPGGGGHPGGNGGPAATGATLWSFEVVQTTPAG